MEKTIPAFHTFQLSKAERKGLSHAEITALRVAKWREETGYIDTPIDKEELPVVADSIPESPSPKVRKPRAKKVEKLATDE